MYCSFYLYRVPRPARTVFLQIQGQAAQIYVEHGALDDATYSAADLSPKYGCAAFPETIV